MARGATVSTLGRTLRRERILSAIASLTFKEVNRVFRSWSLEPYDRTAMVASPARTSSHGKS